MQHEWMKLISHISVILSEIVDSLFPVKLNGGRQITGVLRGFDPFMNLVVDECIEETKLGEKNQIGMVVCACSKTRNIFLKKFPKKNVEILFVGMI